MASLQGKVYAITGGASGIGLATAILLAQRQATVCIADIDPTALSSAKTELSAIPGAGPVATDRVDVSKRAQVDAWIDGLVEKFGRLDGAANVAGVIGKHHGLRAVQDLEDEEWDKIIAVNLTGLMYCMRAQLRRMEKGGSIVNMTSIHGLKGIANHSAYAASKHGVVGLTKAAAQENGEKEIRINAVAPGAIYTPLMQKFWDLVERPADAPFDEPTAFQRQGTSEEAANVVVFLLGPEGRFVNGSVYQVDGGWQ